MKKTTLYSIHSQLQGKLVEFAGYMMPVQYSSIIAEHKAVRTSAGVFDVSHMGEVFVKGPGALDFVQHITVNDASKLSSGRMQYSAMLYEDGGIVDDLLVYRIAEEEFLLVINASNIDKDFAWMQKQNHFDAVLDNRSDAYSLITVQGPVSRTIVERVFGKEFPMEYYHFEVITYENREIIVSRTGYTGELGYEIYFTGDEAFASSLWNKIFEAGKEFGILPAGLGCRDSLRLEMGYCLYGNDIDQTTNPLEAGLGWITKLKKDSFIGKEALLKVKEAGLTRKLVPLLVEEKAFPRHGYDVVMAEEKIGHLTSGTVSPILEKGIALAYVATQYAAEGTEVSFLVRGKAVPAKVVKLPFVSKQ